MYVRDLNWDRRRRRRRVKVEGGLIFSGQGIPYVALAAGWYLVRGTPMLCGRGKPLFFFLFLIPSVL